MRHLTILRDGEEVFTLSRCQLRDNCVVDAGQSLESLAWPAAGSQGHAAKSIGNCKICGACEPRMCWSQLWVRRFVSPTTWEGHFGPWTLRSKLAASSWRG